VPARVQTKLLVAFLAIVGLLIALGLVGIRVLSGVNEQTDADPCSLIDRLIANHS